MKPLNSVSVVAIIMGGLLSAPAALAQQTAAAAASGEGLEEILVTAQKREVNVQGAPLAITAISGATVAKDRLFSAGDVARSVVGVSFTANSPQSNEINIRGVVNTRLSAPSAD